MQVRRIDPEPATALTEANPPEGFVSVIDLAQRLGREPTTIHGWIFRLRREGRGPTSEQIKRVDVARGMTKRMYLRLDYVAVLEKAFLGTAEDRPITLRQVYPETFAAHRFAGRA